jgi:hypothetical protein
MTVCTSSMGSNDAFAFSTAITQAARMKLTPSCTSPMPEKMREREREEKCGEREREKMRGKRERRKYEHENNSI